MNAIRVAAICVLVAVGCTRSPKTEDNTGVRPKQNLTRLETGVNPESLPPQITNQFGMTFRLVTIDTSRVDHQQSFPRKSYYLQESRLSEEQHSAFREAAFGDGTYETINWHYNGGHPSEWREWYQYAQALSKFDAQYDYRLPTRSQWTFACMSGYDQSCDKTKPNAYGITGLMDTNGFAEAVDELMLHNGHEFGVLMGYWSNNWGAYEGKTKPDYSCEYWTICNPDADDSLNESINGRFILLPKETAHSSHGSGG
ncbi:hypothetical protein [Bremerella sp. P1]|uniref:hypothetical protein n=1 Tax=Bremerella sp. P1 TaxID=3026424 RepID=UPI0023677799|nr:hypothetical protein [Bremerella sp. P1]WDI42159.1 hypothetical protein PSR63_27280 [Bremerella sp. P1]